MNYYFFLDETGDHGLSFVDENFPLFLLCGCLIRENELEKLQCRLDEFKVDFFGTTQVILHSREIRKCEGAFQALFDLELKANFYRRLNEIMTEASFRIIGAAVNKKDHIIKYGKSAKDPYALSLSFILERLIFCLDKLDGAARVAIKAEKRGPKEDKMLLADYNSMVDKGTYYVSAERFAKRISEFKFHTKIENIAGLQLADICAYPLARFVRNPAEPYIPFSVIKAKLYADDQGIFEGWGLKIFP